MSVSRQTLESLSGETGFRPATLEKVIRLGDLVADIGRQPVLSHALVLKGGTALSLCFGPPRRLSVDLDFNYVGNADRAGMLRDRPTIERLVEQVARGQGYRVQWSAEEHAGRKVYLRYGSAFGTPDDVQVDLNFLFRIPLGEMASKPLWQPPGIDRPIVRLAPFSEVASGKLVATLARGLPRDLFDTRRLPQLAPESWSQPGLKRTFVALAGTLDRPLMAYGKDRLRVTDQQVRQQLDGMLLQDEHVTASDLNLEAWEVLAPLLDLDDAEREYTDRLQVGELRPELLFPDDADMSDRFARHPALLWKAQNAREHEGSSRRRPDLSRS
jgi:predicted nucleotidyltransferase component of viral defense system